MNNVAAEQDVFEQSYQEVLAFIKHEDDKINRVLTALAFLTVAGVTLFIFSGEAQLVDARFPGSRVDAANVFFLLFIVGVVLALASALVALDPTSYRPRFLGREVPPEERSPLFYEHIAGDRDWWDGLLERTPAQLQRELREAYHADTARLANRARHKVMRFAQCQAFLQFSIVSLALLAVVRLPEWTRGERWWISAIILAATGFLPHWDLALMHLAEFPGIEAMRERRTGLLMFTLAGALGATLALTAAPLRTYWFAVAFSLGWLVLARFALPWKRIAVPAATLATSVGAILLIAIVVVRALT